MSMMTTLKHNGATCQIHAYGATVTSFQSADGREHLFVSKDALLDGSKPIRGGIPLVFPIFGPPKKAGDTMPQHGFARRNVWTLASQVEDETAATAVYTLAFEDVKEGIGSGNTWADAAKDGTDCKLEYTVRLEASQLTTTLVATNTGATSFDANCLLHTYYQISNGAAQDPAKVHVSGLGGYSITDQVTKETGQVQSYDESIDFRIGEVDRIYIHPDDHPIVHASLKVGEPNCTVKLEAAGQMDGQVAPVSCVVWNPGPQKAAAMGDFGNDQYHDMMCVEPGLLGHQALLEPGQEMRLTQTITVVKE